jgi:hypothetical protein
MSAATASAAAINGKAVVAANAATHLESFNRAAKLLAIDTAKQFPGDAKIYRVKERILTAASLSPEILINTMGPYLFKYNKQIYKGDAEFFIANSYDEDIKTASDREKTDAVEYIMPKVKEAWKLKTEGEKQEYMEAIQQMLDDYIEYLTLTKKP